jgi:hypothetical protein
MIGSAAQSMTASAVASILAWPDFFFFASRLCRTPLSSH